MIKKPVASPSGTFLMNVLLTSDLVLAEPFRCGTVVTKSTRTVFRYVRQNTTNGNGNGTISKANGLKDTGSNVTTTAASLPNDYVLPDGAIFEDMVVPDMADMTRIVNGENCPPGQCPWQVRSVIIQVSITVPTDI